MSFLERINDNDLDNMQSIVNQIAIIFSNRNDVYYTYDFKRLKLIAVHEIFKFDYFSPEFSLRLKECIEAVDPRVENIIINVSKDNDKIMIEIDGQLISGEIFRKLKFLL